MIDNVILVGMPSSGKSTVGRELARVLGLRFVDLDRLIEAREGMLLQEIIDTKGNDYFLSVEKSVCETFGETGCVVATGGSAIFAEEAIERLRRQGKGLYIRISEKTCEQRLTDLDSRGVTLEPGQTIADLYRYRIPYYEKHADLTVDSDDRTVEEVVEEVSCLLAPSLDKSPGGGVE